jgi:transcriptional regulator with XRE-family HTH domain
MKRGATLWNMRTCGDAELGGRLRGARKRAKLTQAALAAELGVCTSAVCMWETGQRGIGIDDLLAFALATHATFADLIGEANLPVY